VVSLRFEEGVALDRLLVGVESVTQALHRHPGPLPVLIELPVAGSPRRVRLPQRVAWDDRLADDLRRAAGIPLQIEIHPAASLSDDSPDVPAMPAAAQA
jgi:hypothetical protein